jgi:hypothetical protein
MIASCPRFPLAFATVSPCSRDCKSSYPSGLGSSALCAQASAASARTRNVLNAPKAGLLYPAFRLVAA